jgi:ubiquinone/menaquinone biosynthesis C-methylase UbiE
MLRNKSNIYFCPYTKQPLKLVAEQLSAEEVLTGKLVSATGIEYPIQDGIPLLLQATHEIFNETAQQGHDYYQSSSASYDAGMDWLFKSFYEDEEKLRNSMIELLNLKSNYRVLEIGSGTCRDSVHIARRIGTEGELFMQDISFNMLSVGQKKMQEQAIKENISCNMEFFVGSASSLPFPDGYFDAVYHFGGVNIFTHQEQAIAEMARVVRVGGKVVFGDEGVAPWLKKSLYGNILTNANKLYQHAPPLDNLPECARQVSLRWILGNAFYLIDFVVGEGYPPIDLNLPIPGKRGGTLCTRFYGQLEGVMPEVQKVALQAAQKAGVSVHEWLNQMVYEAASKELEKADF